MLTEFSVNLNDISDSLICYRPFLWAIFCAERKYD